MNRHKWLLVLVIVAVSALGLTAEPASASSVSCWGDYCSGQDPMATGCAEDAVTVAFEDLSAARLELRWSPTCKTNWARYIEYPAGWAFLANNYFEVRAVQEETGYTQRRDIFFQQERSDTLWTPMIYSPVRLVRAQLVPVCSSSSMVGCSFGMATGIVSTDAR